MLRKRFYAIFGLCVVLQALHGSAEPVPIRGRKRAFGAGLLGGAVAGAVVTHAFTHNGAHHHHHHHNQPTTVENGPLMANGCYQQTVKAPDPQDSRKFIETVQMICPPGTPAAPVAVPGLVPVAAPSQPPQPAPPVVGLSQPFGVASAAVPVAPTQPQPQPPPQSPQAPVAVGPAVAAPLPAPALAPVQPPQVQVTQLPPQPQQTVVYGVAPGAAPPAATPPQVFVLSKKTGFFGRSSAGRTAPGSSRSAVLWLAFVVLLLGLVLH